MAVSSVSNPVDDDVFAARRAGLAASAIAMVFAIHAHAMPRIAQGTPAVAPRFQTSSEVFPADYQNDARARITKAVALDKAGKVFAAEMELRAALTLADPDANGHEVLEHARTLLAVVMFKDGRRWEAWRTAGDLCRGAPRPENRRLLDDAQACD